MEEARRQDKTALCLLPEGWETAGVAGLWDAWKEPNGGWLQSFSIITTTPNELTASVHDRMPVILKPTDYSHRLSREATDQPPPNDLLRPYDADLTAAHPVGPKVGNVRNNDRGCVRCMSVRRTRHEGYSPPTTFPPPYRRPASPRPHPSA